MGLSPRLWAVVAALMLTMTYVPIGTPTVAHAAAIGEIEPNDDRASAQPLPAVGVDNAVTASIKADPEGDIDFYKFDVVLGRTYVVEVYDVESAIGQVADNRCYAFANYVGLGLVITNAANVEKARQCDPYGSGNVQNSLVFTADSTGTFYLEVFAESADAAVIGSYHLRILPKHDEPGAMWNEATLEPNNRLETAHAITPGLANAVTTTIEQRNIGFTTDFVDTDWYRFDAVAGRTYTVELYNVEGRLTADIGNGCYAFANYRGLALLIYSAAEPNTAKAGKCDPDGNGAGNVHFSVEFTADATGVFYIKTFPNANVANAYGSYSLRVLPKFDEPGAAWDTTSFEPNNRASNAYPISVGRSVGLSSQIEARNSGLSTNFGDIDWYRFEAVADQRYVVEIYDVDSSLGAQASNACNHFANLRGLALFVFSPALDEPIAGECDGDGAGNVHRMAEFTANASGWFYIQTYSNSVANAGGYKLRVLPAYDQPGSSWDGSAEPNNAATHAYPLPISQCSSKLAIEPRRPSYLTNKQDFDWFVINTTKDESYVIELLDVASSFGPNGLEIVIFDQSNKKVTEATGGAMPRLTLKAAYEGTYSVLVYPADANASGIYRLRAALTLGEACDGTPLPPAIIEGPPIAVGPGRYFILFPAHGGVDVTITVLATCSVGVAQNVSLALGVKTLTMDAVENNRFRRTFNVPADLPTDRTSLEVSVRFTCSGVIRIIIIGPLIPVDPSGKITDARTGVPVVGAKVTLYRVPNALPDKDGQRRDCRTTATRDGSDWSKVPPADLSKGVAVDALQDSLNDVFQASPPANPQFTGSDGRYSWDVVEGCWFVVAEKKGYQRLISPLVGVPAAVTDLDLKLVAGGNVYLPLIVKR